MLTFDLMLRYLNKMENFHKKLSTLINLRNLANSGFATMKDFYWQYVKVIMGSVSFIDYKSDVIQSNVHCTTHFHWRPSHRYHPANCHSPSLIDRVVVVTFHLGKMMHWSVSLWSSCFPYRGGKSPLLKDEQYQDNEVDVWYNLIKTNFPILQRYS